MKSPERDRFRGVGRKVLLALLFVALAGFFLFGKRGLWQWNKLRRQCEEMRRENDSLEQEIAALAARIQALEAGDSLEVERAARYWGMVREGEEIYFIREEGDTLSQRDKFLQGKQ
ncbi:MAG TPA: septum formation initiator family protein [bacterium]|jgi:cell division protein FtsB